MSLTAPTHKNVDVLIIGSGFGGLAMAHGLRQAGRDDFLILERGDEIGGTWRDNRYPGAACDVPSHLYSLSFAPNPDWSRSYSGYREIQTYLKNVSRRFDLRRSVRFGQELLGAEWLEDEQVWRATTADTEYRARVIVSATGALSDPVIPDLPGLDVFRGELFHSAQWRDDVALTGKRVAVVGTGASAVQIVPSIAADVASLALFQRTPAWVLPRGDWAIGRFRRALYRRVPGARLAARAGIFTTYEMGVPAFTRMPWLLKVTAGTLSKLLMRQQIPKASLRKKITPGYDIGCKRILKSNTYYRALARPNVDVIASGVERLTPTGVVASNGEERDVDVVVFSTGFAVQDMPIGHRITRRDGLTLAEAWAKEGMAGLRGTTVPGCPNLFMIVGPNTGVGHTSMVYVIESQVRYVLDALRSMDAQGLAAIEPADGVVERWNAKLQKRMSRTVWNRGGCASWYLDGRGRNSVLWPGSVLTFRQGLRKIDLEEYLTTSARPAPQRSFLGGA